MTSITIYDGAKTIGGNKIYVENNNGEGVFLDFGLNLARQDTYYDGFLSERYGRGIYDPVCMGLIPCVDIYRKDLVPTDMDAMVLTFTPLKVKAILLSHAHVDHCGDMGLIDPGIPILTSATSTALLKATADIGVSAECDEVAYLSLRKKYGDGMVLVSDTSQPYVGRGFYCPDGCPASLSQFLKTRPGKNKPPFGGCPVLDSLSLPFKVQAYSVNHSIYGSMAFILKADGKTIAYTGDFRIGDDPKQIHDFTQDAKNADVLIIEGTRAGRKNDQDVTETDVYNTCLSKVQAAKGLVIADFSSNNFERLESFRKIADATGRKLVILARDAYRLYALQCADGKDRLGGVLVYYEVKEYRESFEKDTLANVCHIAYVHYDEIRADQAGYILCFSFSDMKHLLDIKPDGGTYVYSSSEAFNEAQVVDFEKLASWLDYFKITPFGFAMKKGKPTFEAGYHASGHASLAELTEVINEVDPEVIMPVHTEDGAWFTKTFRKKRVKLLGNGQRYTLS